MGVWSALAMLLVCLGLCTQALEQQLVHGRRSRRDTMAPMVSFFSGVEKRLAALEASSDNSTEERLAKLEAKMEGSMQERLQDMEEKLQGMQDGMQRLESLVNVLAEKVAELVENKANATEESTASLEASKTQPQASSATCQYKYQYQFQQESSRSTGDQQLMEKLETELTRLQDKVSGLDRRLQDNDLSLSSLHNASVLAIEGVVHSVTEQVAGSERNLESAMRGATESLVSLIKETKGHLLASMAASNASMATMEQKTEELVTWVSTLEDRLDNSTTLPTETPETDLKTLSGPEMAAKMKVGTRVVRGADWEWGNQDGPPPGQGRIIKELSPTKWVKVRWDSGDTNDYRMGAEGKYDLQLA